jgi:hypothetical protein
MIELNGKASEHYDRRKNGALNGTSELVKERNFCPRGSILAATEIMQLLAQLLNFLLTLLILIFRFKPLWPKTNNEHSSFVTRCSR